MLADPNDLAEPDAVRDYRVRVREALAPFSADVARWEAAGRLPPDLFDALGGAGLVSERWAPGRLAGVRHALALTDETTRISAGLSLGVSVHVELFCGLLVAAGRSESHPALLNRALAGAAIGCVGSTEPSGGSSIHQPASRADRVDGGWLVSAEKWFITNAAIATHAIISVTAYADDRKLGSTLFVVDFAHPAVDRAGSFDTLGMRACDTSRLRIDGVVADENRLGRAGTGLILLSRALQMERILAARMGLTSARAALLEAGAFLRDRRLDGVALIDRQALRHRLADCSAQILAAEALLENVVARMQAGSIVEREIAATKLVATRTACEVIDECLQFLGGRGYTTEYGVERRWRDSRVGRIGGGSDEIMREVIAGAHDRAPAISTSRPSETANRGQGGRLTR